VLAGSRQPPPSGARWAQGGRAGYAFRHRFFATGECSQEGTARLLALGQFLGRQDTPVRRRLWTDRPARPSRLRTLATERTLNLPLFGLTDLMRGLGTSDFGEREPQK